jgi:hypothetical protein
MSKTQFLMLQQVVVHIVTTRLLGPGFVQRAVHAESVVGKVALGQHFLRPLKLSGSRDSVDSIQTKGWRSSV